MDLGEILGYPFSPTETGLLPRHICSVYVALWIMTVLLITFSLLTIYLNIFTKLFTIQNFLEGSAAYLQMFQCKAEHRGPACQRYTGPGCRHTHTHWPQLRNQHGVYIRTFCLCFRFTNML